MASFRFYLCLPENLYDSISNAVAKEIAELEAKERNQMLIDYYTELFDTYRYAGEKYINGRLYKFRYNFSAPKANLSGKVKEEITQKKLFWETDTYYHNYKIIDGNRVKVNGTIVDIGNAGLSYRDAGDRLIYLHSVYK